MIILNKTARIDREIADIDDEIRKFLRKDQQDEQSTQQGTTHNIYLRSSMDSNYKRKEKSTNEILRNNVKVTNPNDRLKLIIYYKSVKTTNLLMKNNLSPKLRDLARTHLIYDFTCKTGECMHLPQPKVRYIGTLARVARGHVGTEGTLARDLADS